MKNRRATKRPSRIETLEGRILMSGASVHLDEQLQTLVVHGTPVADQIEVACTAVKTDHEGYDRVWNILLNGKHTQYVTPFVYHVSVYGDGGSDKIAVSGLPSASTSQVYTRDGISTLKLDELSAARLAFHGAGQDTLTYAAPFVQPVNDFAPTSNSIQIWKNTDRVTFDGVRNLNFIGGVDNDRINVKSVPYNLNVNVDGEQGDDIISVGNGKIAQNIRGQLHLDGGSKYTKSKGIDTIVFDDTQSDGGIYTLDYNAVKMPQLLHPINWTATENVILEASNQNDIIDVDSAAEKSLKIRGNGGNDVINVGGSGPGGTLGFVQTAGISINGGAGVNTIIANDQFTGGPQGYIIGKGQFKAGHAAWWNTANIASFTLWTAGGNSYVNAFAAGESTIVHGGAGDDTLLGGPFSNHLYGGAGNDAIFGNSGDDFIDGGTGSDYMTGGAGWDTISYEKRTHHVAINLNKLSGQGEAGENDSIFNDFEVIQGGQGNDTITLNINRGAWVYGNGGSDTLTGSNRSDALIGGAGNDLIKGMGDNDIIDGGSGIDQLAGGLGNDLIFAKDGDKDTVDGGGGNDSIYKDAIDLLQAIK